MNIFKSWATWSLIITFVVGGLSAIGGLVSPTTAVVMGTNSIAVGSGASIGSTSTTSLAINGTTSSSSTGTLTGNIVIGIPGTPATMSVTTGSISNSIAIGAGATNAVTTNANSNSIAIGTGANTGYAGSTNTINGPIAIGNGAAAAETGIAIGTNAIGSVHTAGSGIAIGNGANANGYSAAHNIVLGDSASVNNSSYSSSQSILVGYQASAKGTPSNNVNGGIAIGSAAQANGGSSSSSITNNYGQLAIGYSAQANYSGSIAIGTYSKADGNGMMSLATGAFAAQGDMSIGSFPLFTYTTGVTATEMNVGIGTYATTTTSFITLINLSSYFFEVDIVAQTKGGGVDTATWQLRFAIQRGAAAANTILVGTPSGTTAPLFATAGATTGAWAVAVTADTTNGRPAIKVTGTAATNISWVATVKMTKVGY